MSQGELINLVISNARADISDYSLHIQLLSASHHKTLQINTKQLTAHYYYYKEYL